MTAAQLVALFEVMLKERWQYVWGSAQTGVVDCSGAFVYAFRQYGLSIYHGSNTIYRQHLTVKGKIGDIDLVRGMAVFKWREEGEPDKYIADGLDDFYHIGLYAGGNRVLEARGTKAGFVEGTLKGWTHAGRLKGVMYEGGDATEGKENGQMATEFEAIVTAAAGSTVKLRAKASLVERLYWDVPMGARVKVLEQYAPDGWLYCEWDGRKGYMQRQYLVSVGDVADGGAVQPGDLQDTVTLTLSRTAARELLTALQGQI